MKPKYLVWPILLAMSLMLACRSPRHEAALKANIALAEDQPDSALAQLRRMDRTSFSHREQAIYALAYTIAQDKCGLHVSSDSLLRCAFNYFIRHSEDSLYGRCMHYMGKYYRLCDSLERAIYCLNIAEKQFVANKDTANLCLTLFQKCMVIRPRDAEKGLAIATQMEKLYRTYSKANLHNSIYSTLKKAECLAYCNRPVQALKESEPALKQAFELSDSDVISDVYQDMSWFADDNGDARTANQYARLAYQYARKPDISVLICLADSYRSLGDYNQCLLIADTMRANTHASNHSRSYMKCRSYMRLGRIPEAEAAMDSAIGFVEKMYYESLEGKEKYYAEMMKASADKFRAEQRAYHYRLMFLFWGLLVCCALGFLFVYLNNKKRQIKMKQLLEEERKQKDRLQIEQMQQLLIQRYDIVEALKEKGNASPRRIVIRKSDWEDIENLLNCTQNQFVKKIREQYQHLTEEDFRLLMLVRLDIPSKTLAAIYGINDQSVRQKLYMFKEKLTIPDETLSLRAFIRSYE